MSFSTSATEIQTVPTASLNDLDLDAFDTFLREHLPRLAADDITHEDALLRLRLAAGMGNRLVPTYAGIYLFGREPQWLLPQLGVVVACFDGDTITDDVKTREHLEGSLFDLFRAALAFVDDHAQRIINQVAPDESTPEFPRIAVREAIVNALVHRDLRAAGPVAVRIFADRLEIFSPGPANGLPEPIARYAIRGGVSLPRNPVVATVARMTGLVEQLGRGLPMIRESVAQTHGEAEFVGSKEGVLVTIPSLRVTQVHRASKSLAN